MIKHALPTQRLSSMKNRIFSCVALCIFASFIACSGGAGIDLAGIDGSGSPTASSARSGVINGFGSVIVSGVRYDTDTAEFVVSGEPAQQSDLSVGQFVTVIGEIDADGLTGRADQVIFQPDVLGSISAINEQANALTVLGQSVRVTNATVFSENIDTRSLDGLVVDDGVRVSGTRDSQGVIIATFIETVNVAELELFGKVQDLDAQNFTFNIGTQEINFANALELSAEISALNNGVFVAVSGTLQAGVLLASEIDIQLNPFGSAFEIDDFEIFGAVTEVISSSQVVVSGFNAMLTEETLIVGGELADLSENTLVKIRGSLLATGDIRVDEIEINMLPDIVLFGLVEDVSILGDSAQAVPVGQIALAGTLINTNENTVYRDLIGGEASPFNLANINVGDTLIASVSVEIGEGSFFARVIERIDSSEQQAVRLVGSPINVSESEFTLFIYNVVPNDDTQFILDGEAISVEEFIVLSEGQLVEVEGDIIGTTLEPSSVTIISNDDFLDDFLDNIEGI